MAIYTVLAPPARGDDGPGDPVLFAFVKDGFCWPAFFFAVIWLLYRRLWLVLVVYVVVMMGLSLGFRSLDLNGIGGLATILLHILFALEANNLRRWTLERRGWRLVGLAEGRNLEEAEIRFFSASQRVSETAPVSPVPPVPPVPPATRTAVPPVPPAPQPPPVPPRPSSASPSAEAGDVVGLFPAPVTLRGSPS